MGEADETTATDDSSVDATPTALAHAADLGVDISQIRGTGKDGKITKADVEAAVAARPQLVGASDSAEGEAPEIDVSLGTDQANGKVLVSITTRHPDPIVVAVNGRAVWEGTS